MVSWGILPLHLPYSICGANFVNRTREKDDKPEDDEGKKDVVQMGVQEAQEEEDIEKDKEYQRQRERVPEAKGEADGGEQ